MTANIKSRIDALKEAIKAGTAPAMTKDVRRLLERSIARESGSAWCRNCGRGLTDPESVRLGIGPECRKPFDTRKTKP